MLRLIAKYNIGKCIMKLWRNGKCVMKCGVIYLTDEKSNEEILGK